MTRRFGEQVAGGEKVMISKCKDWHHRIQETPHSSEESPVRSQG